MHSETGGRPRLYRVEDFLTFLPRNLSTFLACTYVADIIGLCTRKLRHVRIDVPNLFVKTIRRISCILPTARIFVYILWSQRISREKEKINKFIILNKYFSTSITRPRNIVRSRCIWTRTNCIHEYVEPEMHHADPRINAARTSDHDRCDARRVSSV